MQLNKKIIYLIWLMFYGTISCALTNNYQPNPTFFESSFRRFLQDVNENSIRNRDWNKENWQKYINTQLKKLPINNKQEFNEAVQSALKDLNDNHSFLVIEKNHHSNTHPHNYTNNFIRVKDGIGIIHITTNITLDFINQKDAVLNEHTVKRFHDELAKIKSSVSKGWIIDLQNNEGGNMYPMLACLSDFLSKKNLGGFYMYKNNNKTTLKQIVSFDGKNFLFNNKITLSYNNNYPVGTITLPTIVIINNRTASSGEFIALALQRQPNVILIGQHSSGTATANVNMKLPNKLGCYMLAVGHYLNKDDKPLLTEKVNPGMLFLDPKTNFIEEAKKLILRLS
jgi:C-terminal processing protease CtpA/Prc